MLKKLTAIMILCPVFSIVGCQTVPNTPSQQTETYLHLLQDRSWTATQIGNSEIRTASTTHQLPSLQFDAATGRVSGTDGCNRIMGSYTAGKDTLRLDQLAHTQMACLNNQALEQKFNAALAKVSHYQVFGKTLKLLDRYGNLLIQLESTQPPR